MPLDSLFGADDAESSQAHSLHYERPRAPLRVPLSSSPPPAPAVCDPPDHDPHAPKNDDHHHPQISPFSGQKHANDTEPDGTVAVPGTSHFVFFACVASFSSSPLPLHPHQPHPIGLAIIISHRSTFSLLAYGAQKRALFQEPLGPALRVRADTARGEVRLGDRFRVRAQDARALRRLLLALALAGAVNGESGAAEVTVERGEEDGGEDGGGGGVEVGERVDVKCWKWTKRLGRGALSEKELDEEVMEKVVEGEVVLAGNGRVLGKDAEQMKRFPEVQEAMVGMRDGEERYVPARDLADGRQTVVLVQVRRRERAVMHPGAEEEAGMEDECLEDALDTDGLVEEDDGGSFVSKPVLENVSKERSLDIAQINDKLDQVLAMLSSPSDQRKSYRISDPTSIVNDVQQLVDELGNMRKEVTRLEWINANLTEKIQSIQNTPQVTAQTEVDESERVELLRKCSEASLLQLQAQEKAAAALEANISLKEKIASLQTQQGRQVGLSLNDVEMAMEQTYNTTNFAALDGVSFTSAELASFVLGCFKKTIKSLKKPAAVKQMHEQGEEC